MIAKAVNLNSLVLVLVLTHLREPTETARPRHLLRRAAIGPNELQVRRDDQSSMTAS